LTGSTDQFARRFVRSWHIAHYVLVGSTVRYLSNFPAAPTSASVRNRRRAAGAPGAAKRPVLPLFSHWPPAACCVRGAWFGRCPRRPRRRSSPRNDP